MLVFRHIPIKILGYKIQKNNSQFLSRPNAHAIKNSSRLAFAINFDRNTICNVCKNYSWECHFSLSEINNYFFLILHIYYYLSNYTEKNILWNLFLVDGCAGALALVITSLKSGPDTKLINFWEYNLGIWKLLSTSKGYVFWYFWQFLKFANIFLKK